MFLARGEQCNLILLRNHYDDIPFQCIHACTSYVCFTKCAHYHTIKAVLDSRDCGNFGRGDSTVSQCDVQNSMYDFLKIR